MPVQLPPSSKQSLVVESKTPFRIRLVTRDRVRRTLKHALDRPRGQPQAVRSEKVLELPGEEIQKQAMAEQPHVWKPLDPRLSGMAQIQRVP